MIFIRLAGGLGNQLFQYAFARSLAHDLDKKLFIDISYFTFAINVYHVVYGLHPYNIKGIVGNYSHYSYENKSELWEDTLNYYEKGEPLTNGGFYYKNNLRDNIDKILFPAYFTGYYSNGFTSEGKRVMTENFFKHNKEIIREDFKYLLDLTEEYAEIANDMENYDSIALHIRRGDYKNISNFGTCSVKYYEDAIETLASQVDNAKFYIFTEDHEWFDENIHINYPYKHVFFKEEKESIGRGYANLLKLMSSCKHFIIGNSTFSWWGAWLGEYVNKIIIAPKPWFQSREILEVETIDDVIPIHIINNYEEIFNKTQNILFKLKDSNDFHEIKEMNIKETNGVIELETLSNNSQLIISPINKIDNNNAIMKLSLSTSSNNFLRVFYKKQEDDEFSEANSFLIWYYENEEFDHYVILPKEIQLTSLMIRPAFSKGNSLKIKNIEIREIQEINNI